MEPRKSWRLSPTPHVREHDHASRVTALAGEHLQTVDECVRVPEHQVGEEVTSHCPVLFPPPSLAQQRAQIVPYRLWVQPHAAVKLLIALRDIPLPRVTREVLVVHIGSLVQPGRSNTDRQWATAGSAREAPPTMTG